MAFSVDLRKRVVASVDDGMSVNEASAIFDVSGRVIYDWLDLREETGSIDAKSGYQKGHSHKITDWKQFKEFAEKHRKLTSPKMVVVWERFAHIKVSESTMKRALRKIGYTFKKNLWLC